MPKWQESRTTVMQVPFFSAFSRVRSIAVFDTGNPGALFPWITRETGVSCTISGFACGTFFPSHTSAAYMLTRATPCEACPLASASTNTLAVISADSSGYFSPTSNILCM